MRFSARSFATFYLHVARSLATFFLQMLTSSISFFSVMNSFSSRLLFREFKFDIYILILSIISVLSIPMPGTAHSADSVGYAGFIGLQLVRSLPACYYSYLMCSE